MNTFRTPYRHYDVMAKWDSPSWNDTTRRVVRKRLTDIPPRRFLDEDEWRLLAAICARLLPQPDRSQDAVPIVPWLDEKLHKGEGEGYRYEDLPPMREAWRIGLKGVEGESRRRYGTRFTSLPPDAQDGVLAAIQRGEVEDPSWQRVPPQRFFRNVLLSTVVGIYYSHPSAWSECGFGGPASPRGYVRLEAGKRDAWEAETGDER